MLGQTNNECIWIGLMKRINAGPILGLDKKHCSVGSDNMLAFYLLVLVMLVGHIITQDVIFHAQLLCTKRVSYRYISLLGHTLLGLGLVGQINLTLWSFIAGWFSSWVNHMSYL